MLKKNLKGKMFFFLKKSTYLSLEIPEVDGGGLAFL